MPENSLTFLQAIGLHFASEAFWANQYFAPSLQSVWMASIMKILRSRIIFQYFMKSVALVSCIIRTNFVLTAVLSFFFVFLGNFFFLFPHRENILKNIHSVNENKSVRYIKFFNGKSIRRPIFTSNVIVNYSLQNLWLSFFFTLSIFILFNFVSTSHNEKTYIKDASMNNKNEQNIHKATIRAHRQSILQSSNRV